MDNRFGTSRLRLWAVVGRGHDEPMFKAVTTVCHLISCEQKGDLSEGDQQLLFWSAEAVEAFVLFFCILMCVCVFFWGDHDLKVDFDGTEGIYIYISIQTGFEQWGCQSDIDCGFYSYMYISTWLNLLYIVTWFCYQHLHAQFFMCWGCPQSLPKESSLVHSDSEAFGNLSTLRGREGTQPLDALPLRRCLDQDRLVKVAWRFN